VGARVTFEPRQLSVEPGGPGVLQVRVENTGQVVDQFAIDVVGDAAGWAVVEPPAITLLPGREGTAMIRILPPRDPRITSGERPLGIRVQSHEDPQGSVVEEGTISLGAFSDTGAELLPRNSRGHRRAKHEVAVDNRGNAPLQTTITATDPDNLLAFKVQPPVVIVPPGTAGFSRLRVRARKSFWSGPPRQHPFQVQVQPQGQAPIALEGAMIQEGLLAGWVLPVLGGALGLLVLLVGAWFLLLKPAIDSTAKAAVEKPLAQQSAAIADLQNKAAAGGGGGGGGAQASPSPGGGGAAVDNPLGKSTSKRLTQTANSYPVPDKATYSVTDVVFENPNAEKGTIQLRRNNDILLSVNLDNFRDLDYHFVAPLTFGPKEVVQATFNCSTGCGTSAVFLNGYQKGP
jgi:hypothetical protein